jgi:VWFA-related protein
VALCWAASLCALGAFAPATPKPGKGAQNPQTPVFRSSVELVAVDVQVVDRDGQPITSLTADQFEVSLDGRRRPVVSADLIRYSQSMTRRSRQMMASTTPLEDAATDRIFILAVDQLSLRAGPARAAAVAARQFIDRLKPDDLVGLYFFPPSMQLDLTHDRVAVRARLNKVVGLLDPPLSEFNLSLSEVVDITASDGDVLSRVVQRECARGDVLCAQQVRAEALAIGGIAELQIAQRFSGLSNLLGGLRRLPGRKTLVLLSGGLLSSDRASGRPNMRAQTQELGKEAAAANTNLYVLHLDSSFLESYSAESNKVNISTVYRDNTVLRQGLEALAGAAGGALFRIEAGTPEHAFDRVMRETSAYYLLGLEVADVDRDGRPHYINVKVRERGATVRNRPLVVVPRTAQ